MKIFWLLKNSKKETLFIINFKKLVNWNILVTKKKIKKDFKSSGEWN